MNLRTRKGLLTDSKVLLSLSIMSVLALSSMSTVHAQTNSNLFGLDINGPVYLDSYWTSVAASSASSSQPLKQEVAPGDGPSILAVVLVNRGSFEITDITGSLSLSSGFTANGRNNGPDIAVTSFNSPVSSGQTFTLLFEINVPKNVNVGDYASSLDLSYSRILETGGLHTTTINVPFKLTGKVILDASAETQQLIPGQSNNAKILLSNTGSRDAVGVTVTITGVSGGSSNIAPSSNVGGTSNQSNALPSSSSIFASAANLGKTTFYVPIIPANNGNAEINSIIYPSNSAGGTTQVISLALSFNDAYGNPKTTNLFVGFVVSPNPPESVLSVAPTNPTSNNANGNAAIITAGKIQQLNFTVSNNGDAPLSNVILSLGSQSDSLQILGNSVWTFKTFNPGTRQQLSTIVFATTSMIAKPASFTLTGDYISGGQSKKTTLNLGSYITGEIRIRAYDIAINSIGSTPNLVGNLLNEGNTLAMFTTIEVLPSDNGLVTAGNIPPSQYLGDLDQNSPLPFNIPLMLGSNNSAQTIAPGNYPVMLKVTYKDDLRLAHELVLAGTVNFVPNQSSQSSGTGASGSAANAVGGGLGIALIVLAVSIAIVAFAILRRRRSRSKNQLIQRSGRVDDIDEILNNPTSSGERQKDRPSHDSS